MIGDGMFLKQKRKIVLKTAFKQKYKNLGRLKFNPGLANRPSSNWAQAIKILPEMQCFQRYDAALLTF